MLVDVNAARGGGGEAPSSRHRAQSSIEYAHHLHTRGGRKLGEIENKF